MDQKESADKIFHIRLKDFNGDVVKELHLPEPLRFPYLFWKERLYVTSRDDTNTLLERSHHVLI